MLQSNWPQLLDDLRNVKDVDRAVNASEAISEAADETRISELYSLLEDDNFFVREAAAVPLTRLEGVKALPKLFQALTHGNQDGHDNDLLSHVIAELLEAQQKEAAPVLLNLLADPDNKTRAHAAWALGFVASQISASPLLDVLDADADPEVRSAVIGSLSSFKGQPNIVDRLIGLLQDPNEQVRISAISSLGYLNDKRAISPLKDALKNSNGRAREFVEYALTRLKAL